MIPKSQAIQTINPLIFLTGSLITCLILLIQVSFKIILLNNLLISAASLLCPFIALLYFIALCRCSIKEQRHVLTMALGALYIFCIGIFILLNLPAAESMHNNPVYQVVFDDIPKKFFAVTFSFICCFYLPHWLISTIFTALLKSPYASLSLALSGGLGFFLMVFYFLFIDESFYHYQQIFENSASVALLLLIGLGLFSGLLLIFYRPKIPLSPEKKCLLYSYLVNTALVIMLMCLACEYRLIHFIGSEGVLTASAVFFPITLFIGTLIGEIWGFKRNAQLCFVLVASQFLFDCCLTTLLTLPSPDFFNFNFFYNSIMLRRLPAASLTLLVTFLSNACLLYYLKKCALTRSSRILIANTSANSLLCLINYSLLFGGIYPYEQVVHLVVIGWFYKLLMMALLLPLLLKGCQLLESKQLSSVSN